ncbi:hypothetical protein [Sorangium sp. So ce1151]|uniref:hypothetical protein n=1 Tax=Sorangium sp. So ce1151 TaxID=3133332 RepID=UPI003F60ED8A
MPRAGFLLSGIGFLLSDIHFSVTAPLAKIFATRRARGGEEPPQPVVQPPQPPPGA